MSLEDMNRKAVRRLRKQDKAKPGARKQRSVENNQRIARQEAMNSNFSARQAAIEAPSVKEVGDSSLKTGDVPEEVDNDSGYGTHMEYPQMKCTNCAAKFHTRDKLNYHTDMYHGDDEKLFGA